MNWIKKKAFKWFLAFMRGRIKSAGPEFNELYINFYTMSISQLLAYLTNKIAARDLNKITFPDYLKELNNPLKDDVEEWIDGAIDGLDPREG